MKPFTYQGIWWLPDAVPENHVGGVLSFRPDDGLRLALNGVLRVGDDNFGSDYPMIHGIVRDAPDGRLVSLVRSFRTSFSMSAPGYSTEIVAASEAFFGSHLSQPVARFSSGTLSLTYLDHWIEMSGITEEFPPDSDGTSFKIIYESPARTIYRIQDATLEIRFSFRLSQQGKREVNLKEGVGFRVQPDSVIEFQELQASYFYVLQNFLSFATDRPNAPVDIHLSLAEAAAPCVKQQSVRAVYHSVFLERDTPQYLLPHDMLFEFGDVRDNFEGIISKWFEISRDLKPALDVFFGTLYSGATILDFKLESVLRTFYLFFRDSGILKDSHAINYSNSMILFPFETLAEHIAKQGNYALDLLGGNTPSFIDIIRRACDQLLLHRDSRLRKEEIYWTIERLNYLFKFALLHELGFSDVQLARLLVRNRQLSFLRSVRALESANHGE